MKKIDNLRKYIKYLISFLIIFGLTVNDGDMFSQTNSSKYYQVLQISTRKEFRHKYSKLYVYGSQILTERIFVPLISYLKHRDIYGVKVISVLKLQIERYQKISSILARQTFLNKKFVSSNKYPSLYIA
ncbi:conserved hypothetical protein [Tenacibaculum amylolyticum]